ncbi:hypothetical protein OS493_000668 [Desmophyllum pertusum]|uniref:Uncharacterized protein n=1 Tax=Desmophyllum pertusum TaxID=174260 RepID=A0A9X0A7G9_9CNID|nr:hypothetical protein OS493_000668 [Desmophyllum pertusum]
MNLIPTGTYICEDHLTLADKDEQVCRKAGYTPPKKRSRSEAGAEEHPRNWVELKHKVETLEREYKDLEQKQTEQEEKNIKLQKKLEEITKQNAWLMEDQQQKEELNNDLKEENIMLQKKLNGDTTFSTLVQQFHKALVQHYSKGGKHLYDPDEMEKFCYVNAPGLFEDIFIAIYNEEKDTPSNKRTNLQRVRVVAILHNLSFFRNQKNCPMQKANGLQLKLSGASYSSLMSGMVLGYSCHPHSINNYEKSLAKANMDEVRKKVHLAVKEKQFILLVEDDIHFIHAPRKPSSSTTSTSWHMCTALADIHDEIEAVPQNVDINQNHRSVRVTMTDGTVRQCRGGIDINHLLGYLRVKLPSYFSSSYLSSLPGEYKRFDLSNVQHSFENLRVYWDAARNEMETLRTSWLLDEFQQNLHSKADYSAAFNHLLEVCPELGQYMADFQLVLTGDFPTWKYNKKLVAEWNEGVTRRIPLIIPWQGPFHVVLNAEESTVQIFWAFFEKLYKALFGRNKRFPKKSKSEKVSLISTAAFGGWLIIRESVLDLFGPCKDPQYVMLVNLLDEISCFNFFFYTAFFRGGNFETWLHSLLRGSMMFINFRRRNYDKATLCQLSDILFHVSNNVGLGERIQQFLQVFTEKKVEILHSVLRR